MSSAYLSVFVTQVRARVVHAHHPRVPVLEIRQFDVRITRPEAGALAQRAPTRQTRAREHRPRTLPFCPGCPGRGEVV